MARYGKNIIFQTNWPEDTFDEMQQKLVEQFPEVVRDIENTICKIVDIVIDLPPEKVLQRAWGEMAVHHMGMASESDADADDVVSLRMVDYLQSVIASVKPKGPPKDEVEEDDWQVLRDSVEELFNKLNIDYQISKTALRRKEDPDFDIEYEEF